MTPIQDIHFSMGNEEVAHGHIELRGQTFAGEYTYKLKDGTLFGPSRTIPMISAALAFEGLLHEIRNIANGRGTAVTEIDSVCNAELVDKSAMIQVTNNLGLSAKVHVNGKP